MISRYVLLASLAALAPPALAQETLSLEAALGHAAAQNPELLAMRERAGAAASRVDATLGQRLPRVGVEVNAQRTDNAALVFAHRLNAGEFGPQDFEIARLNAPGAISHLGTSLFVEVPIDLAGRISLAADARAAGQRSLVENIREAEATLAFQVTEAYFSAVLARSAVGATEKAAGAARLRETSTEARADAGVSLRADVLRVRARRRAREADLAAKRSDLVVAEAMLRRLMGEPDGPAFELTETPRPASAKDSLETWMAKALSRRPALRAAAGQRSAAALERRIEERGSWPDLAGQARVMDDRTSFSGGGRSWAIGAVLRWSLFDATRQKRVSAAVADERAAAFDEQASRDLVRFEVGAAFSRLTAASERLAAAEGGALEGREALRIVQERRAQGLATLTDELETEAAAFAAELEEISAAKETVMAEAALRRAAGQSPWSVIQ